MASSIVRLIQRNLPFHQSRNVVNLRHLPGVDAWERAKLIKEDWFHVLLRRPTGVSIISLLAIWTFFIFIFASIYQGVDNAYEFTDCGLSSSFGKLSFGGFFAFSLQTCTTVGYGLPGSSQAFFQNCPAIQFIVYCQMMFSMMFNAFLFAFVFNRMAKSESRASQVIMSGTCCIHKNEEDKWIMETRVNDTDAKYSIVESHVRIYARTKTNELVRLRTFSPNDDTGAMLFLSWPSLVCHEIDSYSALHPHVCHKYRLPGSGLFLREVDSRTGNIDQLVCPICSESYGDMDRLRAHVKFNQLIESTNCYPIEGSHQSVPLKDLHSPPSPTLQEMKDSFPEEVLLVVEGIDPLMSGSFQALQSYKVEDVSWGSHFVDCVVTGNNSTVTVDLKKFHCVVINEEPERNRQAFKQVENPVGNLVLCEECLD